MTSDSNYPHPHTSFDEGENEGIGAHYKTSHLGLATSPGMSLNRPHSFLSKWKRNPRLCNTWMTRERGW